MIKGLEALERLVDGNLNEVNYYRRFCDSTTYIMKDKEIIEKELKRLEELEKAFDSLAKDDEKAKKLLSKEIEKNRALEIIKNKEINVHALFLHLKRFDKPDGYNVLVGTKYQITQEEYGILKEVLL